MNIIDLRNNKTKPKKGDYRYHLANYATLYFKDATLNCKHCYLDGISSLSNKLNEEVLKQLKQIFTINEKVTFSINVTDYLSINNFKKHFTMINCANVPTGYGRKGYQYHAIFFTNCTSRDWNNLYRKRFEIEKVEIPLKEIKNKKEKKIDKILSFKSKTWLRKYLEKNLIS